MIELGSWDGELTEKMFLKFFNIILYTYDEYDY